jgi:hypothetical protein
VSQTRTSPRSFGHRDDPTTTFSGRDRAILRAVAAGGAEQLGTEADLFLDGRCRYDQPAAHLVRAGLLATATSGSVGQRVAAALTPKGTEPVLLRSTATSRSVMFSDRRNATSA